MSAVEAVSALDTSGAAQRTSRLPRPVSRNSNKAVPAAPAKAVASTARADQENAVNSVAGPARGVKRPAAAGPAAATSGAGVQQAAPATARTRTASSTAAPHVSAAKKVAAAGRPAAQAAAPAPNTARPRTAPATASAAPSGSGARTARAAPQATLATMTPAQLRARIAELEAAVSAAQEAAQAAEVRASDAVEAASRLDGLLERMRQQHDTMLAEHEVTVGHLRDAENHAAALQTSLTETGATLATTRGELASVTDALSAAKRELSAVQGTLLETRAELDSTRGTLRLTQDESATRAAQIAKLEGVVQALEARIEAGDAERRRLHNTIQELKGNIRVYCRVRPLAAAESGSVADSCAAIVVPTPENGDTTQIEVNAAPTASVTGCGPDQQRSWSFDFDRVYGPNVNQATVFEDISQLVQSALDGYSVCIFAYGQTGSGKTYTMEGDASEAGRGMIPRAVTQLFAATKAEQYKSWTFTFKASFLEIYNEQLRDLLAAPDAASSAKYEIKHTMDNQVYVTDLRIVDVSSDRQVDELLRVASQSRAVARTLMNERSSRSHSIFQLRITGSNSKTDETVSSVLNLVDLAGSERLARSQAAGQALKETQHINKSLTCLGDVISALANKKAHIPYRNSKLTHVLQNYLGGNSKTLMFVNISPTADSQQESLCSLRFAAKVNSCDIGTAKRGTKVDVRA